MSEQTNLPHHFTLEELEALREVVTVIITAMEADEGTDTNADPTYLRLKAILEKLYYLIQGSRGPIPVVRPNQLIIGDEGTLHLVKIDYWALLADGQAAGFVWSAEILAKDAADALALALTVFRQELPDQTPEVFKIWGLRTNVELVSGTLRQQLEKLLP